MNQLMKVLVGYDGSGCADATLHDLRRAGLPGVAEAVLMSGGRCPAATSASRTRG